MTFGVWSSGFGTPHQAPRGSSHFSFRLIFIFILGDDDDGDDDDDDDDEGLQACLQAA